MSSQDMQFADPEWQPPEEREDNANSREQKTPPRPINANRLDQPQWQTPVSQAGYLGPGYAGSQPQTTWSGPARSVPSRRGSPWRWIILAFIIIALMSGAFSRGFGSDNGPGPQPNFGKQVQNFTVQNTPTIVITGGEGDINVSTGGSSNQVSIQESSNGGFFGNPRDENVDATQNGDTITVNDQGGPSGDVGLDVVVPSDANLRITTNGGSIDVEGVNLTGSSSLISNGGDVTFNGSLGSGNYQFQSTNGSGSVNITLPSISTFHLDASTASGSISNDFSSVPIIGNQTHVDVGNSSIARQTTLTLTSDSGDINLSKAS